MIPSFMTNDPHFVPLHNARVGSSVALPALKATKFGCVIVDIDTA